MKFCQNILSLTSILLITIASCDVVSNKQVKVSVTLLSGANKMVLLEQIPFENEREIIVDSALITDGNKAVILHIPKGEQRLFRLRVPDSNVKCIFINDALAIDIDANYINGNCKVQHSPATDILQKFTFEQKSLANSNNQFQHKAELIAKNNPKKNVLDSLEKKILSDRVLFLKRYVQFADTVKSPALFMAVYNYIDFGKDNAAMESFINSASARFPSYLPIQNLKKEIHSLVKIFTEEYNIGDQLPSISLPDKNGKIYSTTILKGKYYFIDFWSTWCPQCLVYNKYKILAYKELSREKFEIVSVAIDAEKEQWQKQISNEVFKWPQLIDTQMWKGVAVTTLKFDSIPFNFLVSPEGRIINKAIKPDSLLTILAKAIH